MRIEELDKLISQGISRVMDQGAGYCDARFYSEDGSETIALIDGNLEENSASFESGLGVRVLHGGSWGFAATSRAMISEANQTAGKNIFDQSGGASRSTAFYKAPIDRMTNVNILPGKDGSLTDIIA